MSEIESSPNTATQTPENTEPVVSTEASESTEDVTKEAPESTEDVTKETSESTEDVTKESPKTQGDLEKPKKSKKKLVIATIIILILAAGITALIIFLYNQPKDEQQPIAQQTEKIVNSTTLEKYKLKDNSLSDFDLTFLKMENEEKNKIYSPLSIKYALGMLKEGTAGNSYTQIDTIIGDYKARPYLDSKNRSLANAMFVKDSFKENIKNSYVSELKDKLNASVVYDPFTNAATINNWVSEKTLGQINNLVSDDTVNSASFALVNALAIDMQWKNQIQCSESSQNTKPVPCIYQALNYNIRYAHEKYTSSINKIRADKYDSMKFNDVDGIKSVEFGADINNYDIVKELGEDYIRKTVKAEYEKFLKDPDTISYIKNNPYNHGIEADVDKFLDKYMEELDANYHRLDQSTDFYVLDTDTEKVFAKDLQEYDGVTLQYVGIMPKSQNLQDYIKDLSADKINDIILNKKNIETENFKEGVITKVTGHIPLFKYDYNLSLTDDLKKLGVTDVFDSDKADLSNMLESPAGDYISEIIHKANIDFSNDGIKAAAATAVFGGGAGGPMFEYKWDVPVEIIDLTFDKPYFYIIRDKLTGEVWFTGTVYEPTKNN